MGCLMCSLCRYEEAFDSLLTLEGALAGLMVDEVYRVLHVVSQAQSLELMVRSLHFACLHAFTCFAHD